MSRLIRACLRARPSRRIRSATRVRQILERRLGRISPADCRREIAAYLWKRGILRPSDRRTVVRPRSVPSPGERRRSPILWLLPAAAAGLLALAGLAYTVRGPGNQRPVFVTEDVKIVGNPTVDPRGQDLRFRVVKDGVLLPARWHQGARYFEDVRRQQEPVTLCYSPRLAQWAEEGPVYLHTWHLDSMTRPSSNGESSELDPDKAT